jgi:hypothetical protein
MRIITKAFVTTAKSEVRKKIKALKERRADHMRKYSKAILVSERHRANVRKAGDRIDKLEALIAKKQVRK